MGLIYQTSKETSADLGLKIALRQSPREIQETHISGQFQRTNEPPLINVGAENNRYLNNASPSIHGFILPRLLIGRYVIWQQETSLRWEPTPKQEKNNKLGCLAA